MSFDNGCAESNTVSWTETGDRRQEDPVSISGVSFQVQHQKLFFFFLNLNGSGRE